MFLTAPAEKIADETFNIGFQNMSIMEIAELAKSVVEAEFPEKAPIEIVTTPSDDLRSYHINSDKVTRVLGFRPKRTIEDAMRDLCAAFFAVEVLERGDSFVACLTAGLGDLGSLEIGAARVFAVA